MAFNVVDSQHLRLYRVGVRAEWQYNRQADKQAPLSESEDRAAKTFGPSPGLYKEVMYMPVKKTNGEFTYPGVHVFINLHFDTTQAQDLYNVQNFDVPAWHGAQVKIKVRNAFLPNWEGEPPLELTGTLKPGLVCDVEAPSATVKQWLDPNGPLKARVNENLFDFEIEVPSIKQYGKPLQTTSLNRVYFYCKKTIVFLPGVAGSQFQVQTSKGEIDAYPNFFSTKWGLMSQKGGILSCDSEGKPLLEAGKPGLLRIGPRIGPFPIIEPKVYDTYTVLHKARVNHFRHLPPENFRLYELQLFAYDWRGDLTEAADAMMKRLTELQEKLRERKGTDDQVAIAGHSTGGVIMRKMLGLAGAESLISHAFFMNVPFRGAPKALSVMLTGRDPPGGKTMIDFIVAESLRDIAVALPIAYHLAPSKKYPDDVVDLPGQAPITISPGKPAIEKQKRELLAVATSLGIYGKRRIVDAGKGSEAIAKGSDDWAEYWDERVEWERAKAFYDEVYPNKNSAFHRWADETMKKRNLGDQNDARSIRGWIDDLGKNAEAFHKASEETAASGSWASKAFIFYSKTLEAKTTGSVIIRKQSEAGPLTLAEFSDAEIWPAFKEKFAPSGQKLTLQQEETAAHLEKYRAEWLEKINAEGTARPRSKVTADSSFEVDQWVVEGGKFFKRRWRISYTKVVGDGTVPLRSLLGFGGPAKVFKPLLVNQSQPNQGGLEHVPAPNSYWAWQRIIEVLQGYNVDQFLATNVDPVNGTES